MRITLAGRTYRPMTDVRRLSPTRRQYLLDRFSQVWDSAESDDPADVLCAILKLGLQFEIAGGVLEERGTLWTTAQAAETARELRTLSDPDELHAFGELFRNLAIGIAAGVKEANRMVAGATRAQVH